MADKREPDWFDDLRSVRDCDAKPEIKHLLLVLYTYCRQGSCWPSIATIAKGLGIGERATQVRIAEAKRDGWLTVESQSRVDGSSSSNRYVLPLERMAQPVAPDAQPVALVGRNGQHRWGATDNTGGRNGQHRGAQSFAPLELPKNSQQEQPYEWPKEDSSEPSKRRSEQAPDKAPEPTVGKPWECTGKQPTWTMPLRLYEEFTQAYPGINIDAEMRKAKSWLASNPTKRKTARGMPRFLNSWLDRAQNDASKSGGNNRAGYDPQDPRGTFAALNKFLNRDRGEQTDEDEANTVDGTVVG